MAMLGMGRKILAWLFYFTDRPVLVEEKSAKHKAIIQTYKVKKFHMANFHIFQNSHCDLMKLLFIMELKIYLRRSFMHDLKTIFNDYLSYCSLQKKLSSKTIKAYTIDLNQFLAFSSDVPSPFERTHLTAYIRSLNQQYKPKSAKRKVAALKAFCSYLVYEDILELHPFPKSAPAFVSPPCCLKPSLWIPSKPYCEQSIAQKIMPL